MSRGPRACCHQPGDLAWTSGHYAAAAGYYQESLALIGEGGPLGWRADALRNLGLVTYRQGHDREARVHLTATLVLRRELDDQRGMAESVASLACLVAKTEPHRSARLASAAEAAVEAMESHLSPSNRADREQALATAAAAWATMHSERRGGKVGPLVLEQAVAEALAEPARP